MDSHSPVDSLWQVGNSSREDSPTPGGNLQRSDTLWLVDIPKQADTPMLAGSWSQEGTQMLEGSWSQADKMMVRNPRTDCCMYAAIAAGAGTALESIAWNSQPWGLERKPASVEVVGIAAAL